MLEEKITGYWALLNYVSNPSVQLAVLLPGLISIAIYWAHRRAGKVSYRLQILWLIAVLLSFYFARWEQTEETQRLYIYSGFSIMCFVLLFFRVYISPALAYALTFLSLWWVDITHALCQALLCQSDLERFYIGVGGAGLFDTLFVVPLLTAGVVAIVTAGLRRRGERLQEI
jgi:hypothetical protein